MAFISIFIVILLLAKLAVACYNYFSKPTLPLSNAKGNKKVSILIPARNEEAPIVALLNSINVQEYSNYEVIVLDDDSSNDTYRIVEKFAHSHPKFRIVKGNKLKNGWTGNNYACHQLAEAASGDYLLFIDADVKLYARALSSALAYAEVNSLALLSLFCDQQMKTFGERGVVPLMNYMLLTLLPFKLILKNADPIFSAACGQFMLFNGSDYRENWYHSRVANEITEDLKIVKLMKQQGSKCDGLLPDGLVSCRMYDGHEEAVAGFSKNLVTPFNDSAWVFSAYLFTTIIAPVYLMVISDWWLLFPLLTIIFATKICVSLSSNQSIFWNIILHPLQIANLFWIGSLAILSKSRRVGQWKGRDLYV